MVKGVQKKIIEVNRPDSLYFERAVFYLKPGVTKLPQQLSQADADALLREAAPERAEKRFWLRTLLLVLLSCLGTAGGLFAGAVVGSHPFLGRLGHP